MRASVIIPTFKRPAMVQRLLANLAKCRFPHEIEICVVENGPQSGVEQVCASNPIEGRVRYLHLAVAGRSSALNHAIRESGADFFIFFDDDVTVPEEMIATYVDAANRYGAGHFFGGPLVADAESKCPSHLLPYLPWSAKGWTFADQECEVPADKFTYFFGANWAVFRSDLLRTGLFSEELGVTDSKFSPVGEELELQKRLLSMGVKPIFLPGAVINHYVPAECYTLAWVWRREFRRGVMEWKMSERFEGPRHKILGVPRWLVRAAAEQSIRAAKSRLFKDPPEKQTEISMREAHLAGLLFGAWSDRGRGSLAAEGKPA
ncbi:MAG: glycosyltransferase [Alphaproteobacteria bacterium]